MKCQVIPTLVFGKKGLKKIALPVARCFNIKYRIIHGNNREKKISNLWKKEYKKKKAEDREYMGDRKKMK